MKFKKPLIVLMSAVFILIAAVFGYSFYSDYFGSRYAAFYRHIEDKSMDNPEWHLVIYMDVEACMACSEDMAAWNKLEDYINENNYEMSFWAPKADSFDVAYAMELEGLITPVRVLDKNTISNFGWDRRLTPIKILFDKYRKPVYIFNPNRSVKESRIVINKIMAAM